MSLTWRVSATPVSDVPNSEANVIHAAKIIPMRPRFRFEIIYVRISAKDAVANAENAVLQ
jgi:hypothetical protein